MWDLYLFNFFVVIMGLKLYDWKTSPVSYPVRWFQCKYIIRRFRSAQRPSIPKVRRLPSSKPKLVKTFAFHWLSPSSTALPALVSWYLESFLHGAVLDWLVNTYLPTQELNSCLNMILIVMYISTIYWLRLCNLIDSFSSNWNPRRRCWMSWASSIGREIKTCRGSKFGSDWRCSTVDV